LLDEIFDILAKFKLPIQHDIAKNTGKAAKKESLEELLAAEEENRASEDTSADSCIDRRGDGTCQRFKKYCDTKYKDYLFDKCAKTCKYCVSCDNSLPKATCEKLQGSNACNNNRARMMKLCTKTCGFCKSPAPPKCSNSVFGCCWDKTTSKLNKDGSNCKACQDEYKYVCKTFNEDCEKVNVAGDFMRRFCPQQCKLCSTECIDAPSKAFYCPFWKKDLKWCDNKKDMMTFFCPKTCNFCG